jgi:hypothetical protein
VITDLRATPLFWQDVHVGSLVGAGYEPYPKLQRWLENMKALSGWSEVNQVFDQFAASLVGKPPGHAERRALNAGVGAASTDVVSAATSGKDHSLRLLELGFECNFGSGSEVGSPPAATRCGCA